MSQSVGNVVKMWRRRGELSTRQGYRCTSCGAMSLARRRSCARCGVVGEPEKVALPRGVVRAVTAAGGSVEHLDQVTGRKCAAFVELDGGAGHLMCLVQHADSLSLLPHLRGAPIRLSVRRAVLGPIPLGEPIAYTLKAVLDLRTRVSIQPKPEPPAKGNPTK